MSFTVAFHRNSSVPTRLPSARRCGFTLVEVAMALGVFSFGVLAVIGLLPAGLQVNRDSVATVVESNILQVVTSDAQATNFKNLEGKIFYFDEEGVALSASTNPNRLYTVNTTVSKTAALATVQIQIKPVSEFHLPSVSLASALAGERFAGDKAQLGMGQPVLGKEFFHVVGAHHVGAQAKLMRLGAGIEFLALGTVVPDHAQCGGGRWDDPWA